MLRDRKYSAMKEANAKMFALLEVPMLRDRKYLVLRRDGSVPPWPYFVLGAPDEAARDALAFYLQRCKELDYSAEYIATIEEIQGRFMPADGRTKGPDDKATFPALHPIIMRLLDLHAEGMGAPIQIGLNEALFEHLSARINELILSAHTWAFARLFRLQGGGQ